MAKSRLFLRIALLGVPLIWQVLLAPFANTVDWQPFGLPFQMVWQMVGVVLATLAIGSVFLMDEGDSRGAKADDTERAL